MGLVALPLAMAFAISSGVTPEAGIYTAIGAGFIVSALGGSRYQIAGPTGAFVVIVAGIVTKFGVPGLLMCTMMAGALLIALALTGLGGAVRFIPRPVTIGFTNGIAVLIASTQIKDFLGLTIGHVPGEFAERMAVLWQNLGTINPTAAVLAVVSLTLILIWPKVTAGAWFHRGAASGDFRECDTGLERRDDRQPVWRHSDRLATDRHPGVPPGPHFAADSIGGHGGAARRD